MKIILKKIMNKMKDKLIMTQTDNLKIKPKKYINLAISISGKSYTIRVFKDVIRILNCAQNIFV